MSATLAQARWLRAPESRRVLAALTAGGRPARFVGGCVRDTLLDPGIDMPDLDLATPELPERVMALCEAAGLKVIPTGLRHGTVTVHGGRHHYEVTTLRRDVATDRPACGGRVHRRLRPGRGAPRLHHQRHELRRRGPALRPVRRRGRPRAPAASASSATPPRRIAEDYLRILRFFRFYGRFGRPPADAAALAACRELAPGIDRLSGERVRQELLRLLETEGAVPALGLMRDTGVLRRILPEPPGFAPLLRLATAWPDADAILRLSVLLRSAGSDKASVEQTATRLRLPARDRDRLAALVRLPLPDPHADGRAHRYGILCARHRPVPRPAPPRRRPGRRRSVFSPCRRGAGHRLASTRVPAGRQRSPEPRHPARPRARRSPEACQALVGDP